MPVYATQDQPFTAQAHGLHWAADPGPSDVVTRMRQATCGQCWQNDPGEPCQHLPLEGDHVARYERAYRRGAISKTEYGLALIRAVVFTKATIIPAGAL